jgi:hypothetical protein
MPDAPKRTINAKLIVEDIQAGVDESEIKRRFNLSDKGYQSVLQKLSEKGLLTKSGSHSPTPGPSSEPKHARPEAPMTWRCPGCDMPQTRAYDECPHCGIIVAKALAMRSQGYREQRSSAYETPDSDAGGSTRRPAIIFCIVVFLVIGGSILTWSAHKRTKPITGVSVASTSGSVRNFTVTNFEREVKDVSRTMPVLVMFHADW